MLRPVFHPTENDMAKSSILGGEPVPVTPPGHSTADLGPSDSSDSGSDIAGAPGVVDDADRDDSSREANDILPDKIIRGPEGLTIEPESQSESQFESGRKK